jgi:hypothetical protein
MANLRLWRMGADGLVGRLIAGQNAYSRGAGIRVAAVLTS